MRTTVRVLYLRTCVRAYVTCVKDDDAGSVCKVSAWNFLAACFLLSDIASSQRWAPVAHLDSVEDPCRCATEVCLCECSVYRLRALVLVPKCPTTQRTPGCIKVLLFFDVQTASEGFGHTFTATTKWRRSLRLFIRFLCYAHKCTNCSCHVTFKFNNCDKPADHIICWLYTATAKQTGANIRWSCLRYLDTRPFTKSGV